MMIPYLLVRDSDSQIQYVAWRADPDAGPAKPYSPAPEGFTYVFDEWGFDRAGRRPTECPYLISGSIEWVETASLEQLREQKNAEINAAREAVNSSTFTYMGKAIRCRPLDRGDIDGTNGYIALFGTFPEGWAGGWKAEDNSYVSIATVDEWKAFYKAMVDTGNANFRHAQQLKAQLAAAETCDQIAAIKWGNTSV